MTNRLQQQQRAGAGSQQIQAENVYFVEGVTEERAVEISREQACLVVRELTDEAMVEANRRIANLESKLITELADKGLLQIFADPAFQILLRKAQFHAASTPEDTDHLLLSKLLVERAQQNSKPVHMVVTQAVEVIEQLDTRALTGLTAIWLAAYIHPAAPDPKQGLKVIDDLVSKVFDEHELPAGGNGWLQRLDMLNCLRFHPSQPLVRWHMPLTNALPGYVSNGVLAPDADGFRARLDSIHPGLAGELVPHPFLEDAYRINAGRSDLFAQMVSQQIATADTGELQKILVDARVDTANTQAIHNMLSYIAAELPNLERLRSWWDSMQAGMLLTPLGMAIAYSNAKRFDQLNGTLSLSDMIGI